LRSRILNRLHDYQAAMTDIERAVQLAPTDARFLLTRARLLGEAGKYDEALRETQSVASRKDVTPVMQAQALMQLGDLLAHGPTHDYKQAIERHLEAIRIARQLNEANRETIDPAIRQVLLDGHLAAAHDIASGRWRSKKEVVTTWL